MQCEHANYFSIKMGGREESGFKVPCLSPFFFINASLNKTKYYLKNGFCKFKEQECYVKNC